MRKRMRDGKNGWMDGWIIEDSIATVDAVNV